MLSRTLWTGAPMLTGDRAMFAAICRALSAASPHKTLVLEGETGSGKHQLARMIHAAGAPSGAMVAVDCSARDASVETALRSLAEAQAARFSAALYRAALGRRVTLLVDDIDQLVGPVRGRLLGAMRRSGAAARSSDESARGVRATRVVATTARPLAKLLSTGVFPHGLDRKLNPRRVLIPPLRRRTGDVILLSRYFLGACGSDLRFTTGALKALCEYPFPGNVRELENLVRRLAIVPLGGPRGTIQAADVRNQLIVATRQKAGSARPTWRSCLEAAYSEILTRRLKTHRADSAAAERLRAMLEMLDTRGGLERLRARIHRV